MSITLKLNSILSSSTTMAFSSALLPSSSPTTTTASSSFPHNLPSPPLFLSSQSISRGKTLLSITPSSRQRRPIACLVAFKDDVEELRADEVAELKEKAAKEGAKVRVKAPLKVFHVPKVNEVDLTGVEGVVKQYVCFWKGKRISANYPFKVEFKIEVEGRGLVKFFAHLKEEEIEFI